MKYIFISYSGKSEDEKNASFLREKLTDKENDIEAIMVPKERRELSDFRDYIMKKIDVCHYFISFYTTKGRNNFWINQELGYALKSRLRGKPKIFIIHDNRSHCKGLISEKYMHLDDSFNVTNWGIEMVSKNLESYIKTNNCPLSLEIDKKEGFVRGKARYYDDNLPVRPHDYDNLIWKEILIINNHTPTIITDAEIHVIMPKTVTYFTNDTIAHIGHKASYYKENVKSIINPSSVGNSYRIPQFHRDKFNRVKNIPILRAIFPLEALMPNSTFEIPLFFEDSDDTSKDSFENKIGIYIQVPGYDSNYYELTIYKTPEDSGSLTDGLSSIEQVDDKIRISHK